MRHFATKTKLETHQLAAYEKMIPTRVGALFMEMGTGKSRTTMEVIHHRQNKIDKVIWFCPVSVKETIFEEIIKHTDCRDICVFDEKTEEDRLIQARWYVVGIESMSHSARMILAVKKLITERSFVIVDESSYIKGHRSLRTERITLLSKDSLYRMILNGTPISQGVVDLYSQFRFLSPKILGYNSFYSFAANHLEYSERYRGKIIRAHNTEWMAAKIKPYVYQVTKEECLTLPEKLYETRYFSMTEEQRNSYEEAKMELLYEMNNDAFDSYRIFRLFGILQQITSGFWNRRRKNGTFHLLQFKQERIALLLDVIDRIPANEKVIIWAKYRYDIEQIKAALPADSYALFYGDLPEKKRMAEVNKFRKENRFLIATQATGGHGSTWNEATYHIFYNNGFKYSERQQAEDRSHRIGQNRPVTYIDLHCRQSIDDRISSSLSRKKNVADDFREEVEQIKDNKVRLKELIKAL